MSKLIIINVINQIKAEISDLRNIIQEKDQLLRNSVEENSINISKALKLAIDRLDPPHAHAHSGDKAILQYHKKCKNIIAEISTMMGLNLPGQELLTLNEKLSVSAKISIANQISTPTSYQDPLNEKLSVSKSSTVKKSALLFSVSAIPHFEHTEARLKTPKNIKNRNQVEY